MIKKILLTILFLTIHYSLITSHSYAITMDSTRFRIDFSNINSASGDKSSSGYKLSDTVGQLAAGQFASTGYIVKAGFQYIHSIIPFSFSVSNINIDLGTLIPNTPATGSTVLSINYGGAGQYQVTAIEETALQTLSGNAIPNTTCDGGVNICSESTARLWTLPSSYGFGYNMSGQDVPDDFVSTSFFRPFPNKAKAGIPSVVMTSTNVGRNRQATLTFKANISPVQPAGGYQTIVNFVATPSF